MPRSQVLTAHPLIGTDEVADALSVSPRTVRRLAERRMISHRRIGGQIRFSEDDIEEYLATSRVCMTP